MARRQEALLGLPPHLVSIGYEGRDVDQLIQTLRNQDVQVLVDVRLTPISRKKGLSKTALKSALEYAGIRYVHLRELGNPKDNRDEFRRGSQASRDRFRRILSEPSASAAVHHVTELLDGEVVALLCYERDHAQCHRDLVAEAILHERSDVEVINA